MSTPFIITKQNSFDEWRQKINLATGSIQDLVWAAATNGLPGWNMTITGADMSFPSVIEYNKGTEYIKMDLTWTNGLTTQVVYSYREDPDAYVVYATQTINYDVNKNVTGIVWS